MDAIEPTSKGEAVCDFMQLLCNPTAKLEARVLRLLKCLVCIVVGAAFRQRVICTKTYKKRTLCRWDAARVPHLLCFSEAKVIFLLHRIDTFQTGSSPKLVAKLNRKRGEPFP